MEQFTFYELYADVLQSVDDATAGKLASYICGYEFENSEPAGDMPARESFYWSNISDMLKEVKEIESAGKIPRKYNLQSKHFTFYDTYYKAMLLMNMKKRGAFVKAICAYMFREELPSFEDKTVQGYFNLCKRKMDISKKRKASGRTGGARKREVSTLSAIENSNLTPQGTETSTPQEILTYDDFRGAYPNIQGELFGSAERYKKDLDWADVAAKYEADEELQKERNIFYLARNYEQKYIQKPQSKQPRGWDPSRDFS